MLHALPHEDLTGLLRRRSLDRKPWLKRLTQSGHPRPRPRSLQAARVSPQRQPPPAA
jgi:hypothetical protein